MSVTNTTTNFSYDTSLDVATSGFKNLIGTDKEIILEECMTQHERNDLADCGMDWNVKLRLRDLTKDRNAEITCLLVPPCR